MPYFGEPVRLVKIQTMSKKFSAILHNKMSYKRFIIQMAKLVHCEQISWILQGMHDRSMRSGTELAWEIQLTDWSTAGNLY